MQIEVFLLAYGTSVKICVKQDNSLVTGQRMSLLVSCCVRMSNLIPFFWSLNVAETVVGGLWQHWSGWMESL